MSRKNGCTGLFQALEVQGSLFHFFFSRCVRAMPLKTYKKTQIMRLSCLALADACVEWGVAWPDNEDDLVIRGEFFKAIRASIAPTEPSEVCEGEGEGKGNVWAEDFCVHIRISSASRPDLAQNHQPKPFFLWFRCFFFCFSAFTSSLRATSRQS